MTNRSPYYSLELAWQALLTPFAVSANILPANVTLTDSNATILHPRLAITTPDCHEDMSVGSGFGVFEAESILAYETKLSTDQQSPIAANAAFEQIIQGFYYGTGVPNQFLGPVLVQRLNATGVANFYAYGIRGGIRIQNSVITLDKLWRKEIRIKVVFLNRSSP
jgi:hypothetical protein